jgi:hypothetical protein
MAAGPYFFEIHRKCEGEQWMCFLTKISPQFLETNVYDALILLSMIIIK